MSRTISVFEHGTLRVGALGAAATQTLTQPEFDAAVRFNDRHGRKYFDVGYRALKFRQFVGYLQIGTLGIEILPKADRNAASDAILWRNVLLEMLNVAGGIDLRAMNDTAQALRRPSLFELVASTFTKEVELLTREGLSKGYREEECNGTSFRGRLMVAQHARSNHSRKDRCFVRYSTFDRDTAVNQLIRAGLDAALTSAVSASLQGRLRSCLSCFEDVRRSSPRIEAFERINFTRSNERYRRALTLARMLLVGLSPALQVGPTRVFAFLFDMNVLWERYVGALIKRVTKGRALVTLQNSQAFWSTGEGAPRKIRPDILIREQEAPNRALAVLDTKWKLAGPAGPSDDDLKQIFAYNEIFQAPRALLLHPGTGARRFSATGAFIGRNHRCEVHELEVGDAKGIRRGLLRAQIERLFEIVVCDISPRETTSASAPFLRK